MKIPVIAIDGPSASGKGTIARRLAKHYGFHYLNSGAIYRLIAYTANQNGTALDDIEQITDLGRNISPIFIDEQVIIDGVNIWPEISKEEVGKMASTISHLAELRDAVFNLQRQQIREPGLVAEGRDMTSAVFPDACVKIFLDVSPEEAARRRHKDELDRNSLITYEGLVDMMRDRDHRDRHREYGALKLTLDSHHIDTSGMSREDVFEACLKYCDEVLNKKEC